MKQSVLIAALLALFLVGCSKTEEPAAPRGGASDYTPSEQAPAPMAPAPGEATPEQGAPAQSLPPQSAPEKAAPPAQ
jgi:PBP1b-binding outer membrane lipoprotein LpoB